MCQTFVTGLQFRWHLDGWKPISRLSPSLHSFSLAHATASLSVPAAGLVSVILEPLGMSAVHSP